ncbi:MAG: bifunctional glutamate N-acetyltransferase/amino-acid acetyltransferase ArgJ [Pseudomonadales bacterium]
MAVNCPQPAELLPVRGIRIATMAAAIKSTERDDLAVLLLSAEAKVSGVFTRSHFKAAPVQLCEQYLGAGEPVGALVINSGNANAATGEPGLSDAREICDAVAQRFAVAGAVLPFSTGVIGERLPVAKITEALASGDAQESAAAWLAAARAIMTTDTVPKAVSAMLTVAGEPVNITGIAKGSGMIRPDMATMLSYLACDAKIAQPLLDRLCAQLADASFNRITVDGDTSTNDSFVLLATGQADHAEINSVTDAGYEALAAGLQSVAEELAQRIVRDAEGATKFVTISTKGGRSTEDCLAVCYTIAESPLVKTALFAADANWGRLCMAIGRAKATVDASKVSLHIGDHCIARNGLMDDAYDEAIATAIMQQDEIAITCDLGLGAAQETVWTCDLSYDYVRINAEYRT